MHDVLGINVAKPPTQVLVALVSKLSSMPCATGTRDCHQEIPIPHKYEVTLGRKLNLSKPFS